MSKHWIHFLDNADFELLDDIVSMLKDNNVLTNEDFTAYSGQTEDDTKNMLYEKYFEKYEDEIKDECETPLDFLKVLKRKIIPRMLQDQIASIKKRISELKSAKDDSETIDIQKKRNENIWLQRDLLAPKAPETIPNVERYIDSYEYAVNKLPESVIPEDFRERTSNDDEKVNDLIRRLYGKPFGTAINLSDFNDEQLAILAPELYKWFRSEIKSKLNNKMLIEFVVGGRSQKHTVQKEFDRIETMFMKNHFFDITEVKYDPNAYAGDIYLNMFDSITFYDYSQYVKKPSKRRSVHGDGFFPRKLSGNYAKLEPILYPFQIYKSYTDENGKVKKNVNTPCFINALLESGIDKKSCDEISAFIGFQSRINRSVWTEIAKTYNLKIHLRIYDSKRGKIDIGCKENSGFYNPQGEKEVYLAEYLDHVFIDKELPINLFAIRNWDRICELENNVERGLKTYKFRRDGSINIDNKKACARSLDVIIAIDKIGGFEMINANDLDVDKAQVFSQEIKEPGAIACVYNEKLHTRKIVYKKMSSSDKNYVPPQIYYADFETCKKTISGKKNVAAEAVPFMLCLSNESGFMTRTYTGIDCMTQMFNDVADNSTVYFHNLGFDGNFFMKYGLKQIIKKGSKIISMQANHDGKTIHFKDSYSLFPKALKSFPSSFPKAFENTNIQKELFPYDYYTYTRIFNNNRVKIGPTLSGLGSIIPGNIQEAIDSSHWNDEEAKIFKENIDRIGSRINENDFDMIKYCEFYCSQDVNVLRTGFNAFVEATKNEPIKLNLHDYLTLPSLANAYLTRRVFVPNKNIYELNGMVQKFIQKTVYGGRCMTANNKRYAIGNTKLSSVEESMTKIADFDACSLYPSAMRRMFTVEGIPEFYESPDKEMIYNKDNLPEILIHAMDENQTKPTETRFYSQFFVEIEIVKVGIKRQFPLIVKRENNKQTNVNMENVKMTVDMITLQDLITFQDISFKLGNGYVMKGKRDHRIRNVIQELFDLRAQYKKDKNPTQEVIKLIMNSAYGKTIQKPIKTYLEFVKPEEFDWFVQNRFHQIIKIDRIERSQTNSSQTESSDLHLFELQKMKAKQFNNVVFGTTVLSMSKRIMNEVMCLAEDLGIKIWYQDTDSMHIESNTVESLNEAFKNKYGRELIGENIMGCFHSDFDEIPDAVADVHISLGKKMYYDRLVNEQGARAEHYRMKGIPQIVIKNTADKQFGGNIQALYEYLYEGNAIEFNCLDGRVGFNFTRSGSVEYKCNFDRKVVPTAEI